MSLYQKFLDGSVVALSKIISHIENRGDGYQELLSHLYRTTNGIYRIGLTGPPGGGKSSLQPHASNAARATPAAPAGLLPPRAINRPPPLAAGNGTSRA